MISESYPAFKSILGEGIDALWDASPHINCSYIVLMHYTMECRLLSNWKVHALRVTAAEGLSRVRDAVLGVAWVETAGLPGDDAGPSVQRCHGEDESSGASVVGRSNQNRHKYIFLLAISTQELYII
jgi:hypothetical protein